MKNTFIRHLLLLALVLSVLVPAGVRDGRADDETGDGPSDFQFSVELDQGNQALTIALTDGEPFALTALEVSVTVGTGGVLNTYTSTEYFVLDAFGEEVITLPIGYAPSVTNFEMLLCAGHLAGDGSVVMAQTNWRYGSRHLASFSDLQSVHPLAYESLVASQSDAESDVQTLDSSVVTPALPGVVGSYAFTSQTTGANGQFLLSGPGNYLATAPVDSFRLVSGPAGIFTAN